MELSKLQAEFAALQEDSSLLRETNLYAREKRRLITSGLSARSRPCTAVMQGWRGYMNKHWAGKRAWNSDQYPSFHTFADKN